MATLSAASSTFIVGASPSARPSQPFVVPKASGAPSMGTRRVTTMGNKGENGIFSPLVRVVRDVMGKKEFNQFRGKAIALHSQVITEFCKDIGAGPKQRQGLIRLAKKNGEWLGFLA
eukprot:jgi/Mesvir1/27287/Mv07120-RA.1